MPEKSVEFHDTVTEAHKKTANFDLSQCPRISERQESSLLPPDSGLRAWLTVAGAFSLVFVSFGWITSIGVFQQYYQSHQLREYSPSQIAWIPSLETCVIFLWGPIVGKLYDNYGPSTLLLIGTFLHVFGLMMVALCMEYYQFILAQSICSPSGASFLFFPAIIAVSSWFHRHRALALGITACGGSVGGVVFPIMVSHLTAQIGFAWTIRTCAFLILGLCIFAWFTVSSRLPHTTKHFHLADYLTPLKDSQFRFLTAGYVVFNIGFFVPYNFIIVNAVRYGMSPDLAQYMLPVLNASGSLGRIVPGWLADRVGHFNVMIAVTLLSALLVLSLWIPGTSPSATLSFAILYGFTSGAFISLSPTILAQISPLRELGARQGTCYAFISIASLIGNPIAGALVPDPVVDPFWKLKVFTGLMMMGGCGCVVVARGVGSGWCWRKVV